jgi:hypothetical protein
MNASPDDCFQDMREGRGMPAPLPRPEVSLEKAPINPYAAYACVAGFGAAASVLIALIGMKSFTTITDNGMWAVAAMVAAPAFMSLGVAFCITLTRRRE